MKEPRSRTDLSGTSSGGVVQRSHVGIGVPIGGGGSKLPEGRTAEGNHRAIEAELRRKASLKPVPGNLCRVISISPCRRRARAAMNWSTWAGEKKIVLTAQIRFSSRLLFSSCRIFAALA